MELNAAVLQIVVLSVVVLMFSVHVCRDCFFKLTAKSEMKCSVFSVVFAKLSSSIMTMLCSLVSISFRFWIINPNNNNNLTGCDPIIYEFERM
jgi:hypothetical protein